MRWTPCVESGTSCPYSSACRVSTLTTTGTAPSPRGFLSYNIRSVTITTKSNFPMGKASQLDHPIFQYIVKAVAAIIGIIAVHFLAYIAFAIWLFIAIRNEPGSGAPGYQPPAVFLALLVMMEIHVKTFGLSFRGLTLVGAACGYFPTSWTFKLFRPRR